MCHFNLPLATTGDPPEKILYYYDNSVIFIIPVLFINDDNN